MKKIIGCIFILLLMLLGVENAVYADKETPKILYKSFLPLPDERLLIFGKVISEDLDEMNEKLEAGQFENFFENRFKGLTMFITIGNRRIKVVTDKKGDFNGTFPGKVSTEIKPGTPVIFTFPRYPGLQETVEYNLPQQPVNLVISDIDDTVLITQVPKKLKLVANTFFVPHKLRKVVPGTPEIYNALIKGANGPESLLVFLSGSPVYLAARLEYFFLAKGFPSHALILRNLGPTEIIWDSLIHKDDSVKREADIMQFKFNQISKLLKMYQDQPVILLGDSGEKDPEIYQKVIEAFSNRVRAVIIHDVTKQTSENPRYEALKKEGSLIVWDNPIALRQALEAESLISKSK